MKTQAHTFFVSPHGSNDWSGSVAAPTEDGMDGPFATLGRARDAVRALKMQAGGLDAPVIIQVRQGKYFLEHPLLLTAEDSGTRTCPVSYTAYPGERPVLSGGTEVAGWRPLRDGILQADLPGAKGGKWKFRRLYLNGERQIRARWPKFDPDDPIRGGWAYIDEAVSDGVDTPAQLPMGFRFTVDQTSVGGKTNAFRYKLGSSPKSWAKPTEAEAHIFVSAEWCNDVIPVRSIDRDDRVITLAREAFPIDRCPWFAIVGFKPGARFYIDNVLEELTQPGEWCFDSEEGVLYFWPPSPLSESDEVVAPRLDCLIDMRGASWVEISGFVLTETIDGENMHRDGMEGVGVMFPLSGQRYCGEAVHMNRTYRCTVQNNVFRGLGGNGIYLQLCSERNFIRHNEIGHLGACGVCLAGSSMRGQHPMLNRIEDNDIHHCGEIIKYSAGVFLGVSDGNVIAHNYIHDVPHHAINLGNSGYGRNILEYNEIRRAVQENWDTGVINCWMEDPDNRVLPHTERAGHLIRFNLIADSPGYGLDEREELPSGVSGIYLDDCSSNCFVYGNIIVAMPQGIYVHNGKNNIIENNVLIDCHRQFLCVNWVSEWAPETAGFMTGNRWARNIAYSRKAALHLFLKFNCVGDRSIAESDGSVYFGPAVTIQETGPGYVLRLVSFEEWRKSGYDEHSIAADPMFVDVDSGDYRLKDESPALALGIQSIDCRRIGIRK